MENRTAGNLILPMPVPVRSRAIPAGSMRHCLVFTVLAVGMFYAAARMGGAAWVLLWPAGSLLVAGLGYWFVGPRIYGKRLDGTFSPLTMLGMLPFLGATWALWHLRHLLIRTPAASEVAPGLWLGRRVGAADLPAGLTAVVDLTSEFWEPRAVREACRYICVPTLDAGCTDQAAFESLLDRLENEPGPIYLHCAQGYGRSAALAAAILIRRGLARDVADAEQILTARRPGVRLNPAQRELVRRVTREFRA